MTFEESGEASSRLVAQIAFRRSRTNLSEPPRSGRFPPGNERKERTRRSLIPYTFRPKKTPAIDNVDNYSGRLNPRLSKIETTPYVVRNLYNRRLPPPPQHPP